jgi:hypothetical protein
VKVESIDDAEEMLIMDEAFDILGFTHEEKFDVYKCSSTCMVMSRYADFLMGQFFGFGFFLDLDPDILSLSWISHVFDL